MRFGLSINSSTVSLSPSVLSSCIFLYKLTKSLYDLRIRPFRQVTNPALRSCFSKRTKDDSKPKKHVSRTKGRPTRIYRWRAVLQQPFSSELPSQETLPFPNQRTPKTPMPPFGPPEIRLIGRHWKEPWDRWRLVLLPHPLLPSYKSRFRHIIFIFFEYCTVEVTSLFHDAGENGESLVHELLTCIRTGVALAFRPFMGFPTSDASAIILVVGPTHQQQLCNRCNADLEGRNFPAIPTPVIPFEEIIRSPIPTAVESYIPGFLSASFSYDFL